MLARANRLVTADEFRLVSRRGRRVVSDHLVVTSLSTEPARPARFGFIITRKAGNAVRRNKLRRRLRALAWEHVHEGFAGADVVVRALPTTPPSAWGSLSSDFAFGIGEKVGQ